MEEDNTTHLPVALNKKWHLLLEHLNDLQSVVLAFSGGVDSALLLKAVASASNCRSMAIIGDSVSLARSELKGALELLCLIEVPFKVIGVAEMENEDYLKNPVNRCYFCKTELYTSLESERIKLGYNHVIDGTNLDDLQDYRPGLMAKNEKQVMSPLVEAKLNKNEIRALSEHFKLPTFNKPSMPCLASRIPYGQRVTVDKLNRIEKSEAYLYQLGYIELRVRNFNHGKNAVIELPLQQLKLLQGNPNRQDEIKKKLLSFGFEDVLFDEKGFRSGSLNESLQLKP